MVFVAAGEHQQSNWQIKAQLSVDDIKQLMNIHEAEGQPQSFYNLICALVKFPYLRTHRRFRHTCIRKTFEFKKYASIRQYPNMYEAYKNLYTCVLNSYDTMPAYHPAEKQDKRCMIRFLCTF